MEFVFRNHFQVHLSLADLAKINAKHVKRLQKTYVWCCVVTHSQGRVLNCHPWNYVRINGDKHLLQIGLIKPSIWQLSEALKLYLHF